MRVLAIDPGPTESAYVLLNDHGAPVQWQKKPNGDLRLHLEKLGALEAAQVLAVEMVASYGMPVGAEVFDTCVWIGRFIERWGGDYKLIPRAEVKLHLTNTRNAKDANVRQALIDRFGPGKDAAVGKKANPGPLYGLTGDCWSALAVAVTVVDSEGEAA